MPEHDNAARGGGVCSGARHEPGVYALTSGVDVKYVGIAVDLAKRFNQGYGRISPRNCFRDGRSTNCHINKRVLAEALSDRSVTVWFLRAATGRGDTEAQLIGELDPPWNTQLRPKRRI